MGAKPRVVALASRIVALYHRLSPKCCYEKLHIKPIQIKKYISIGTLQGTVSVYWCRSLPLEYTAGTDHSQKDKVHCLRRDGCELPEAVEKKVVKDLHQGLSNQHSLFVQVLHFKTKIVDKIRSDRKIEKEGLFVQKFGNQDQRLDTILAVMQSQMWLGARVNLRGQASH